MTNPTLAHNFFDRHRDKIAFAGPDECWLWTAGRFSNGYGAVLTGGKTRGAHREAFEARNGAGSADGLVVRHRCDVRACINPAHLELGTQGDNMRDKVRRGRCRMGEDASWSKLTEEDVRTIRSTHISHHPVFGCTALARRFGVARTLVSQVVHRNIWRHV